MNKYMPILVFILVALSGSALVFCSLLLDDADRNGITWCCTVGGVCIGMSPVITLMAALKLKDDVKLCK